MTLSAEGVTVVICAYADERWDDLVRSVASLEYQSCAGGGPIQRVLVIDNNAELLERSRQRWGAGALVLPNDGPQGLSSARNTALAHATGAVVAFLDDDATAAPGWLRALTGAFEDPAVLAAGGEAQPIWPDGTAAPPVLPREMLWIVGCSFEGQSRGASVRNVMGCNMAFRTEGLRRIGGFETSMGRVGRVPLGAEETDACIRLRRSVPTGRVAFVEGAVVRHAVHPRRTTFRYVLARSYGEGVSKAALARSLGRQESLGSERGYALRVVPRAVIRELASLRRDGLIAAGSLVASVAAAALGYLRAAVRPQAFRRPRLRSLPQASA